MRKSKHNVTTKTGTSQAEHSKKINDEFIMLPTVDFCFKELMNNENIRKGMIAAILNVHPREIEKADLMPTILRKEYEDDKYGILDVRVKLTDGTQIDFEMQMVYFEYWANRTLFYLGKMYTDQIKEGEGYENLKKCIQVSIFDHVYFNEDDRCYRRITFRDDKMNQEYTDLMEIHILELPKLPAEQQDETSLVQWMRFLGGKSREDFEKMAEKNPEIKEAYDMLDKMSADERKRLEYEERQKLIRDKMWIINGMKRQCEKAMQEGREKGMQEGREKGMQEGRLLNIREMLLDNVPLDKIKQYTKATDEEIENEQKKLNEEKPIS